MMQHVSGRLRQQAYSSLSSYHNSSLSLRLAILHSRRLSQLSSLGFLSNSHSLTDNILFRDKQAEIRHLIKVFDLIYEKEWKCR